MVARQQCLTRVAIIGWGYWLTLHYDSILKVDMITPAVEPRFVKQREHVKSVHVRAVYDMHQLTM